MYQVRSPQQARISLVSEHASLCVICRDDTSTFRHPLDQDVNSRSPVQGNSPHVQVKNPTSVSKRLLVGSSCKNKKMRRTK